MNRSRRSFCHRIGALRSGLLGDICPYHGLGRFRDLCVVAGVGQSLRCGAQNGYVHQDFSSAIFSVDSFCHHLGGFFGVDHNLDLPPSDFVSLKNRSFLLVMVSECPYLEPSWAADK